VRIVDDATFSITGGKINGCSAQLTEAEYRKVFLKALENDLRLQKVVIDEENPEFEIRLSKWTIYEMEKEEKITDVNSPQNNQKFQLTTISMYVSGSIQRLSDQKSNNWSAAYDLSETITSQATTVKNGQGVEQTENNYKKNAFDKETATRITEQIAMRSEVKLVQTLVNFFNR